LTSTSEEIMRRSRLVYLLLALYLTFIGGSSYYATIFPVRVAHHVIVTVLLSLWLIGRIRKQQGLPPTPLNPAIYASVLVWFFSAIFALDTRMALENIWFLLIHTMLFFIVVNLIQCGYQRLVMEILFFMAAIVLLYSAIELASWFFGLGLTGSNPGWIITGQIPTLGQIPRLSLALGGVSTLQAGYIAPLVIVTTGWAWTTRQSDYRIALMLMSLSLFVALIFTSSRGGILSLIAAVGTFAVIRLLQYPPLTRRISPIWLLGVSTLVSAIVLAGFLYVTLPLARGNSDSGRLDMYRSAVLITCDHPVTGVGAGMFGRAFREYRNPAIVQDKLASAHNLYLNTAAELGLPGMVVGIWLWASFGKAVWSNWRNTPNSGHRRRIEVVLAALAGLAIHSMVDVFSITPIVLMILTLVAYAITSHPRSRIDVPAKGHSLPPIIALVMIVAYGVAFVPIDRANALYFDSWQAASTEQALAKVREAQSLDAHLNLYYLQEAYLIGLSGTIDEAINAYEAALALEPTWETGWVNLALLEEEQGHPEIALNHLEQAYRINGRSIEAWFNWGRIAETYALGTEEAIVRAYRQTIHLQSVTMLLPLSEYWDATPLRQQAVTQFLEGQSIEIQYRVLTVHDPSRLAELIPATPQTAAEWWVVGEYALSIENDAQTAYAAFSQAIELASYQGDYYVARARSIIESNPEQAEHDARVALVLGTRYEHPKIVLASLTDNEQVAHELHEAALPPLRITLSEFTAVLFNRPSVFDLMPAGYAPGQGG
jgi:putative inorganic carbon (hco3(-)) transporter